jgi:mannosyl-3-phosphoglycerate phosphatase
MSPHKLAIFTDLDGTLLDGETYSYDESLPAIIAVKRAKIPLVFCSSKTRAEQEVLRSDLGIDDPFIVEDGSALYVPSGYFPFEYEYSRVTDGYEVSEFALPYAAVRRALASVGVETGVEITGYGDLGAEEIARITGLDPDAARRAKRREYQETVLSVMGGGGAREIEDALARRGFNVSHGGRFIGVGSSRGKGYAARALIGLLGVREPELRTAAIGDGKNDASLLDAVDFPFLVQRPGGQWEDVRARNLTMVPKVGPEGWRDAVQRLLGG